MEPMTREDAITEMELLNHGFFLFFNSESKEFNVIYRRRDGGYGIIEPELT
jgi:putative sigma-54 modulation protein